MADQRPTPDIDRFLRLIGGMQNLPPKLPVSEPQDADQAFKSLPSTDQFLADNPDPGNKKGKGPRDAIAPGLQTAPGYTPQVITPPNPNNFKLDEHMGEASPVGKPFAVFAGVAKFCYKFVDPKWMQPLATNFFDAQKIYAREWELYYIWSSHAQTAKPVIFVPQVQLQALIDDINKAFPDANIYIDDYIIKEGLITQFDDANPELRPKFLGTSSSKEQHDWFVGNISQPPNSSVDRNFAAFKAKLEKAVEVGKGAKKGKRGKGKTQQESTQSVAKGTPAWQLEQAQKLLGLRASTPDESITPDLSSLSLTVPDPDAPAPFPRALDAIFIAVDVEAWEKQHRILTEVGVATLDTRDLACLAPGPQAHNWHQAIRGRHFWIDEHKSYRNSEFVQGCPERFTFGKSEIVGLVDMPRRLTSCFHEPYSGPGNARDKTVAADDATTATGPVEEKRNLVLVGHDVDTDIAYLKQLGFNVLMRSNLNTVLDTAAMFRAYEKGVNPRSLGAVVDACGVTAWNLHNAGNDAVYTLQALVGTAVMGACGTGGDKWENLGSEPGPELEPEATATDDGKGKRKAAANREAQTATNNSGNASGNTNGSQQHDLNSQPENNSYTDGSNGIDSSFASRRSTHSSEDTQGYKTISVKLGPEHENADSAHYKLVHNPDGSISHVTVQQPATTDDADGDDVAEGAARDGYDSGDDDKPLSLDGWETYGHEGSPRTLSFDEGATYRYDGVQSGDDGGVDGEGENGGDKDSDSRDDEGVGVAGEYGLKDLAEGMRTAGYEGREDEDKQENEQDKGEDKPTFGPERPPVLYTSGGAVLDV